MKPLGVRQQDSFLPDFGDIRTVFLLVLFVQLLAFLLELADGSTSSLSGLWSGLGLRSMFILWVTLVSAGVIYPLQPILSGRNEITQGIVAFVIVQMVTFSVSGFVYDYLPKRELVLFAMETKSMREQYFRNIAISSIVSALLLRYLYVRMQWEKQVRAEADARLDALQSRMRPHFLFNSLNTVASLTRFDPKMAEAVVEDLAELFRACLKSDARLVSLGDEAALASQYLNIEKQRLGKRLRALMALDGLPQDALIPSFSLQPLIENAVYHGIELAPEGGDLTIRGQFSKGKITISVRNSMPVQHYPSARPGNRLAVNSIRTRLQGSFPGQSQLFISSADGFYQVSLVFPYVTSA